jgi:hypothetical protein
MLRRTASTVLKAAGPMQLLQCPLGPTRGALPSFRRVVSRVRRQPPNGRPRRGRHHRRPRGHCGGGTSQLPPLAHNQGSASSVASPHGHRNRHGSLPRCRAGREVRWSLQKARTVGPPNEPGNVGASCDVGDITKAVTRPRASERQPSCLSLTSPFPDLTADNLGSRRATLGPLRRFRIGRAPRPRP